jgi:Fungal rhodopsin domain
MTVMHIIYAEQSLNIYAMFVVKLSICAYLMPLAFKKGFKAVIWISVVVLVISNFVIPSISHFGECQPIAMNWNPNVGGKCWPLSVRLASSYLQAAANIATDLVYAASPMAYLSEINVPRRTKLGIRIVFILALA